MDGLKKILESKKAVSLIVGVGSNLLGAYIFKDNPEMAEKIMLGITSLVGIYLGAQGAADAFGSDTYHNKKEK